MCNLYSMAPKEAISLYFRAMVPDEAKLADPVPPFGWSLFLRPAATSGEATGQADGSAAGGGIDVADIQLEAVAGQWGLIRPGAPARCEMVGKRPRATNNARAETVAKLPTFRQAWARGQRCLIPAQWYQEPNWESSKNIWWRLRRADGQPWAIAGLWSEWVDPTTGEVVPSYTAITVNCDDHPMLRRLHRPDPERGPDDQDKRSLVHIEPQRWNEWLHGDAAAASALLRPAPVEMFDQADALKTDEVLRAMGRASPH